MKAIFLASALLLGAALTPATAAPMAPLSSAPAVESALIQAQYNRDRDRDYRRNHRATPPRYRAGGRYKSAPRGWNRYDRRPGDWSRRGCVMVGPLWFCP